MKWSRPFAFWAELIATAKDDHDLPKRDAARLVLSNPEVARFIRNRPRLAAML